MAGVLSAQATGTIVKIKESNTYVNYIVIAHNYPKSSGTLLLRKDLLTSPKNSSGRTPVKPGSSDMTAFLNTLTDAKSWVQTVTIKVADTSSSSYKDTRDTTAQIFMLSIYEMKAGTNAQSWNVRDEGTQISYFDSAEKREATLNGTTRAYWTRSTTTHYDDNNDYEYYNSWITTAGGWSDTYKTSQPSTMGWRPAFVVPSNMYVTDDGALVVNSAPSVPSSINVPAIKGGEAATISWGASTDPDGNLSGYILERKLDSASFTQVYRGPNRSVSDTAPKGTGKVQYRVKAYDSYNAQSGYRTSNEVTVINNTPPVISGSNGNLGSFGETAPTYQYTVTDADGGTVTVTEKLDNTVLRTYNVTLGGQNTLTIPAATWRNVLNGSHTLTITATDPDGASSTRTQTFTKSVASLGFTLAAPMAADAMPDRCVVNIQGSFPAGSTLKVEICNNANDASPTWEDITTQAQTGQKYFFTNKTKTAASWGVNLRVSLSRGEASGACYVSSIGGNFE